MHGRRDAVGADARPADGRRRVSDVRVDGDRATAMVGLRGNAQDSVRGAVDLVRQDGGWRLDDLSTQFLRTSFNAGLDSGGTLEGALVVCIGTKIRQLDDAALRTLAFGADGRPAAGAGAAAGLRRGMRRRARRARGGGHGVNAAAVPGALAAPRAGTLELRVRVARRPRSLRLMTSDWSFLATSVRAPAVVAGYDR